MKCLDQQGLKYLWNLIKANFATDDEVSSKCNEVSNALTTQINNHTGNTDNPHNVTKAQLGLGEFDYEEGTWTPTSSILSGIDSYEAFYVKIGNIVYCNFTLEGRRIQAKKMFGLDGLPYIAHVDVNNMLVGTLYASTGISPSDDKSGFISSDGTENEQVVEVYLDGQTSIKGMFRKKHQNCYLPGYNSNSGVTIEGTFIYRTTGIKNS